MWLSWLDLFSLELPRLAALVEHCVLELRLVSKTIMMALEANSSMHINIRISVAGIKKIIRIYRQTFCKGGMEGCNWSADAHAPPTADGSTRLKMLSCVPDYASSACLVETLMVIGTAIQQLEISYLGNCAELLAATAPIASLGFALTMKISVEGSDPGGRQASLLLQSLVASSIIIRSLS